MSWTDFIRMLFSGEFSWRVYERVMTNVTWCFKWRRDGEMKGTHHPVCLDIIFWVQRKGNSIESCREREEVAGEQACHASVIMFLCLRGEPVIPWKLLSTGLSNSSLELRLWRLWLSLVLGCGGLLWKQTVTSLLFWPIFFNKGRPAVKLNFSIFSVKRK